MQLATKYLGNVEVDQRKIIQFPNGLPGFPDENEFIILDLPNNAAFQLLQSIKTSDLAFVITNPHLIYKNYEIKLEKELLTTLQINKEKDVAVYAIVTLNKPFSNSTLNLRAPVIINTEQLMGKQYILNDDTYSSKASLTPDKREVESC
ncbi:flagellar assembly protein FliW [Oceanobacillus luteolus]|uniref:Flagellar assembly factor FliW n=1 Tax=Oceanobacillus luteolus TaxID=1274358 RepID=A0ABW4HPT7_9BACI|nr:flagellar assembly protein FliW [Oceanobacillus luteolus]MCM3740225.1 flagellar assembly protein FliW [Oceanobacillus luteolus]